MTPKVPWRDDQGGQAIVLVAGMAFVLLLMIGLAVAAGQLFIERRAAQDAADAAAVAGAIAMFQEGDHDDVVVAANADAARNGYSTGGGITVTINHPPLSGSNAGDTYYVEVVVSSVVRTLFLDGPGTVSARAVASIASSAALPGVLSLDPSREAALSTSGSSEVRVSGADILVASGHPQAVTTAGSSTIGATAPNRIRVRGGVSGGGFQPQPETGVNVSAEDPLSAYAPPDLGQLPSRTCCTAILLPGIYDGGIITSGNVTLEPGIYVLRGGGLSLQGGTSSLSGNGVLIFNTTSDHPGTSGTCGEISFQSSEFQLTAQGSGMYQGLLIWQDRACTNAMRLHSSARGAGSGTIYLPAATLSLSASSEAVLDSAVIALAVELSGSSRLSVTYEPSLNARRLSNPALSE